ncbi:hypothetical protein SAMN05216174_10335 [Actinokineospora iranica]|uniref:Uncharacterized protein n=1 Tax=Actinokineospora iranica TaxID=1271860 RepID=A0A1G6MUF0_9PSEU|nr:hypothetical protein SAMN05216174_10335 [Actinokineospora iranica]
MILNWPVLVFDFDLVPYVVHDQRYLVGIAESPETVDELVAVFDSEGNRFRVEFTGEIPGLIPEGGDAEELRGMVRQAVTRYPKEFTKVLQAAEIDTLPISDLVRLVCARIKV